MQLKLCELNAENLFISMEHYEGESLDSLSESQWRKLSLPQLRRKQKPINKIWGLVDAIEDINPDILMLTEVGGKESLDHFNNYFLKNAYTAYFVETNSNRAIDLAFLVKKNLPFEATTLSHRDTPLTIDSYQHSGPAVRFSRDVVEMRLSQNSNLQLILLLTHLKSKISTDKDFQGRDLRRAEANALAALYSQLRQKYSSVPVVVGGDFNASLTSYELEELAKTDLTDFHDILNSTADERISQIHFNYQGQPQPQVLDYLLVSPELKNKVIKDHSYTYRYKSFHNTPHPLPTNVSQRYHMPSDHFPLVLTLEMSEK